MMTSNRTALSSLAHVPMTDDTRSRLLAAGVKSELLRDLSEMGGQSMLTLHSDLAAEDDAYPNCYRKAFDPRDKFCEGCTFQPTCWQGDLKYLRALAEGGMPAPVGVPAVVLRERMSFAQSKPAPPPPPKRKGTAMPEQKLLTKLEQLGYDQRQILRMSEMARKEILSKSINAEFVSINPQGELKIIKTKTAMTPPSLPVQRKAPPPPPGKKPMRKPPPPPPRRK